MEVESRIIQSAFELQTFCESEGWKCCFIGGLAVQRWGEVRATQDADLTLLTGFGNEEAFVDPLLQQFAPRHPNAREFALSRRVLLLRSTDGVPLDIALGAMPFEESSINRSSLWKLSDSIHLRTCSAEDLVVHKVFAGRDIDWIDVRGVLVTQSKRLDLALILRELEPLLELKEDLEALPRFRKLLQSLALS
jgi:hypothetical protein